MSYWQNYRAARAKGNILATTVESVGVDRDVVVTLRKTFDPQTGDEDVLRETLALDEAQTRRQQLVDELADLDAWIEDATPQVETFRAEKAAARAAQEEALRLQEEEALALEQARTKENEENDEQAISEHSTSTEV